MSNFNFCITTTSYEDSEKFCGIVVWGLSENSVPVCLRIKGWEPHLYLVLPIYNTNAKKISYEGLRGEKNIESIMYQITDLANENIFVNYEFTRKKKMFYYDEEFVPVLKVFFSSFKNMRRFEEITRKNNIKISGQEYRLSTAHGNRLVSESTIFYTDMKASASHWIQAERFEDIPKDDRISRLTKRRNIEIQCDVKDMKFIEKKSVPAELMVSFDIECVPHKNDGSHPLPTNRDDICYMIAFIIQFRNERRKICMVVGDCEESESYETWTYEDENTMIVAFCDLVNEIDPDIVTSYNGLGYDFDYLIQRRSRIHTTLPSMSRVEDEETRIEKLSWRGASGSINEYVFPWMMGRVIIDLFPVFKKLKPLKRYNLATVSESYIGESKEDLPYLTGYEYYKSGDPSKIKEVASYCIQDAVLVCKLYDKIKCWIGTRESGSTFGQDPSLVHITGMQRKCMSQIYAYAHEHDILIEPRTNAPKYKVEGAFVNEPTKGLQDNVITFDFSSMYPSIMMAYNICYTTLLPPNHPKATSEYANNIKFGIKVRKTSEEIEEARLEKKAQLMNREDVDDLTEFVPKDSEDLLRHIIKEMILSDIVEEAIKSLPLGGHGKHRKADIEATYISIAETIIERFETECEYHGFEYNKIKPEDLINKLKLYEENKNKDLSVVEEEEIEVSYWFIKEEILEGMVPKILKGYKTKRKEVKKLMSIEEEHSRLSNIDESQRFDYIVQAEIYNQRQNAIKILMNSFYGYTLAQETSKYSLVEGGACVTYEGRHHIALVNKFIEDKGHKVVYNDTDSTMFVLNEETAAKTDSKSIWNIAQEIADEINGRKEVKDDRGQIIKCSYKGILPKYLTMELEKICRFLFLRKKKYAGYFLDKDGKFLMKENGKELYLYIRGIVLARRDTSPIVQMMYEPILKNILDKKPVSASFKIVRNIFKRVVNGEMDKSNFIVVRQLNANYSSQSAAMAVYSRYLTSIGRNPVPGERLEYIISTDGDKNKTSYRMRPPDVNFEVDYIYYISHLVKTPIDELLFTGYNDIEYLIEGIPFQRVSEWFSRYYTKYGKEKAVEKLDKVYRKLKEYNL